MEPLTYVEMRLLSRVALEVGDELLNIRKHARVLAARIEELRVLAGEKDLGMVGSDLAKAFDFANSAACVGSFAQEYSERLWAHHDDLSAACEQMRASAFHKGEN